MSGGKHLDSEERRVRREETKAYLNSVRDLESERQTLLDYRRITQEWLAGAGSDPAQERVDGTKDVHSMDKLLEIDEKIERKCREILEKAANVQELIQSIPNSRHRILLMSRYLMGESMEKTAERLHATERHCYRMMAEALDEIEIKEKEKDVIECQ